MEFYFPTDFDLWFFIAWLYKKNLIFCAVILKNINDLINQNIAKNKIRKQRYYINKYKNMKELLLVVEIAIDLLKKYFYFK
jgi:hypothetical protein